ncbi:MAG: decaprenyl-phosphate phosphoribosyltransferase [Chlamydiota bacterium]|nr:decaprenyl-phosphate phosphoribosyltransferase [Chlamydiota bacterium]
MIKSYLILLRPKQWIKNLIIFAALVFSKNLFDLQYVLLTTMAFVIFCILSSAVYIMNDVRDLEQDRLHPWKRTRPIASGEVPVPHALLLSLCFMIISAFASFAMNKQLFLLVLIYLVMQIAYTFVLKQIVLLDIIVIAIGFVLRAVAGAVSINVGISDWLLLCAFLLALFLGFCKRRQELVIHEENDASTFRPVLTQYSPDLLDALISVVTGATVLAYAIYTVWPETVLKFGTHQLLYTLPFVVYGIFRYLYLVHKQDKGDSPTRVLLTDLSLQINLLAWLLCAVLILYFNRV